jgi:nicotinamide-nucleotide amidase
MFWGSFFMVDFDGTRIREIMVRRRLTLAVAESLTTGNIQAMIGSTSGASSFFEGGVTAYSLEQKVQLLGVDREHAEKVNSVSERVASEMARGVCLKFKCDFGVGTTGYAEAYPEGHVECPLAYFAIWRRDASTVGGRVVAHQLVTGEGLGRVAMQRFVAEKTLRTLLDYLEGAACE